ncbi:hypothetical protein T492DRAFT_127302 [Pavlovales sp. CCMP2436]|nr:hypothetical protein T492DRAFT_127302 [Pavlovales sp. CCMP2436]
MSRPAARSETDQCCYPPPSVPLLTRRVLTTPPPHTHTQTQPTRSSPLTFLSPLTLLSLSARVASHTHTHARTHTRVLTTPPLPLSLLALPLRAVERGTGRKKGDYAAVHVNGPSALVETDESLNDEFYDEQLRSDGWHLDEVSSYTATSLFTFEESKLAHTTNRP